MLALTASYVRLVCTLHREEVPGEVAVRRARLRTSRNVVKAGGGHRTGTGPPRHRTAKSRSRSRNNNHAPFCINEPLPEGSADIPTPRISLCSNGFRGVVCVPGSSDSDGFVVLDRSALVPIHSPIAVGGPKRPLPPVEELPAREQTFFGSTGTLSRRATDSPHHVDRCVDSYTWQGVRAPPN